MKRYALIVSNTVGTVVEQDSLPVIEGVWVECPIWVGPLDSYDKTTNTFTPYEPPPAPKIITKVAFRFRFTDAEYTAILAAAKTDVEVQAWYETFNMLSTADLDNQRTKDGVQNLVSKNLLTQARANEILTAPVQPNERS